MEKTARRGGLFGFLRRMLGRSAAPAKPTTADQPAPSTSAKPLAPTKATLPPNPAAAASSTPSISAEPIPPAKPAPPPKPAAAITPVPRRASEAPPKTPLVKQTPAKAKPARPLQPVKAAPSRSRAGDATHERGSTQRAFHREPTRTPVRATRPAPVRTPPGSVDLRIGLDFGTSASKIIVRPMYQAEHRAYAVPVADFAVAEGEYLWASKLWLDENGNFMLRPSRGSVKAEITEFKIALMREQPAAEQVMFSAGSAAANAAEATTAYLATLLRHVRV